jgi:nucleotide-binding universal stress UspA family protein
MEFRKILVPVDFSDHSRRALECAIALARSCKAKLVIVHAYLDIPTVMREQGTHQLFQWVSVARDAGLEADGSLSRASPAAAIEKAARSAGADLIVMGTHGYTGLKHAILGSVAERTIRTAPCPVVVVRADQRLSSTG